MKQLILIRTSGASKFPEVVFHFMSIDKQERVLDLTSHAPRRKDGPNSRFPILHSLLHVYVRDTGKLCWCLSYHGPKYLLLPCERENSKRQRRRDSLQAPPTDVSCLHDFLKMALAVNSNALRRAFNLHILEYTSVSFCSYSSFGRSKRRNRDLWWHCHKKKGVLMNGMLVK